MREVGCAGDREGRVKGCGWDGRREWGCEVCEDCEPSEPSEPSKPWKVRTHAMHARSAKSRRGGRGGGKREGVPGCKGSEV